MQLSLLQSAWAGTPLAGRAGLEVSRELGFDAVDITQDPLDHEQSGRIRHVLLRRRIPQEIIVVRELRNVRE